MEEIVPGKRGHLPKRVITLAPSPATAACMYARYASEERARFGPIVGLIGGAYA